jgi:hypothetical protein
VALIDQVKEMERQVALRLQELEPAAIEYQQLQEVANRLGIKPNSHRSTTAPRQGSGGRARGRRASDQGSASTGRATTKRQGRGDTDSARRRSRENDVLRLVKRNPGITVAALGKRLRVKPTGLYRVVRKLEGAGAIRKEGRELHPITPSA